MSDPLLIILGSSITMVAGGVIWVCKNRCRNQTVECSSGCCKFHSDSRLRETIREHIIEELKKSSISSSVDLEKGEQGTD